MEIEFAVGLLHQRADGVRWCACDTDRSRTEQTVPSGSGWPRTRQHRLLILFQSWLEFLSDWPLLAWGLAFFNQFIVSLGVRVVFSAERGAARHRRAGPGAAIGDAGAIQQPDPAPQLQFGIRATRRTAHGITSRGGDFRPTPKLRHRVKRLNCRSAGMATRLSCTRCAPLHWRLLMRTPSSLDLTLQRYPARTLHCCDSIYCKGHCTLVARPPGPVNPGASTEAVH